MTIEEKYSYSVLFVEDDDETRKNYVKHLEKYFDNVYEAEDGQIAYEIYLEKKPDILLVDINIPKINGIELLRKIRKTDHNTKAIMISAHSDTESLLLASELKLTKYLVKPISRLELKEAINLVIEELKKYEVITKKLLFLDGGYAWDYDLEELYFNMQSQSLTSQEKKLLKLFFRNLNKTLSYDSIIFNIWNETDDNKLTPLKTTIKNLRKKLPKGIISNVYGTGYKINI